MSNIRLGDVVVPVHYDVFVHPNFNTFKFDGKVDIKIKVNRPVNEVILHALDLAIAKEGVKVSNGNETLAAEKVSFSSELQTCAMSFPKELAAGEWTLSIQYVGVINDSLCGFYRCEYTSPSGEKKPLGVTQFEATDARRALPCWDEPTFKATFTLTLRVPKDRDALSNMPIVKTTNMGAEVELVYDKSPIMSTYLLAWVIGEFDYVSAKTKTGVEVRVYTEKNKQFLGNFSLSVATRALDFYVEYFGIEYPLPKLDLVAIQDFAAGAMENWGLVTYRETRLLIDPVQSSIAVKQRTSRTVCHELAHMVRIHHMLNVSPSVYLLLKSLPVAQPFSRCWFGNLVTMEWWTHLWLNEGFARFMEYKALDHIFPDWDIFTQFVFDIFGKALIIDSLSTSHPVQVEVHHPDDINEIFDTISYAKGASVIRMLESYIGPDNFQKGMHSYLSKFAYNNAKTEDLWRVLGDASNKPVEAVMDAWVSQMGYPFITAKEVGDKWELSQSKFGTQEGEAVMWKIPVVVACGDDKKRFLLENESLSIEKSALPEVGSWTLNAGQAGFYRVMYPSHVLTSLAPAIQSQKIPASDRLGLQSDAYALASQALGKMSDVFRLWESYGDETDYSVWLDVTSNVMNSLRLFRDESFESAGKEFVRELYRKIFESLGLEKKEGEDNNVSALRGTIMQTMVSAEDEYAVTEARKLFKASQADPVNAAIPADLKNAVYLAEIRQGAEEGFKSLLDLLEKSELTEERNRLIGALGRTKSPENATLLLEKAIHPSCRQADTIEYIACVAQGSSRLAWDFFRDKWDSFFEARYSKGQAFLLGNLIAALTRGFQAKEDADEVEEWFTKHPCPPAKRTIDQCLEAIRTRAFTIEKCRDDMEQYFRTRGAKGKRSGGSSPSGDAKRIR